MSRKVFVLVVCLLICTSMASFFIGKRVQSMSTHTPTPPEPGEKLAAEPSQVPSAEPTHTLPPNPLAILLGEEYRSARGGIAFQSVPRYEIRESSSDNPTIQIVAPDANNQEGPVIILSKMPNDPEMSSLDILKQVITNTPQITFTEPRNIAVGGFPGLVSEMTGQQSNVTIRGKVYIVTVAPKRAYVFGAFATPERWPKVEPLADAVIESVYFFEPLPPTEPPPPTFAPIVGTPPPATMAPTFPPPPAPTEAPPPG